MSKSSFGVCIFQWDQWTDLFLTLLHQYFYASVINVESVWFSPVSQSQLPENISSWTKPSSSQTNTSQSAFPHASAALSLILIIYTRLRARGRFNEGMIQWRNGFDVDKNRLEHESLVHNILPLQHLLFTLTRSF